MLSRVSSYRTATRTTQSPIFAAKRYICSTVGTTNAMTHTPTFPIHRLPLPRKTLQASLARLALDDEPTAQRRSTTFAPNGRGIWARTLPLWTDWPLRISEAEAAEFAKHAEGGVVTANDVLRRWDPVDFEAPDEESGLRLGTSSHRLKLAPVLLGVVEAARHELLPHLEVGPVEIEALENTQDKSRDALVDVLSGRRVLENVDGTYGSWSTRYCGHQFGQWAGQLGDGRAISLLETASEKGRCEIQVKGAGRTPFSRSADGLAVLRSGVREYLGCEALAALGIPTTRSLAILTSPVTVMREEGPEPSSLVARIAPSFIRIGHFEALNPGESGRNVHTLFFGGAWRAEEAEVDKNDALGGQGNLEGLRDLTLWVKDEIMGGRHETVKEWFEDVVRRNAETVALWQVYGFMHGVLNTDNISILGLTIDYGPYAFMDTWDVNHICNHSDPTGLYSYRKQPERVLFALDSLASAVLPILGYEAKNSALPAEGWSEKATTDDVRQWDEAGLEAVKGWNDKFNEIVEETQRRFGIKTFRDSDDRDVVRNHLLLLTATSGDFGVSLRRLSFFAPTRVDEDGYVRHFARQWVAAAASSLPSDSITRAEEDIAAWLRTYAARITEEEEVAAWKAVAEGVEGWEATRADAMRKVNPRFILRQWVLEDVIKTMDTAVTEGDIPAARTALARVLELSSNPFEPYGEDAEGNISVCDGEDAERARLAGVGPKAMLGFQCSCSS